MTSGEHAAWVQAIGSVMAIVAAVFVAAVQNRQATHLQVDQQRKKALQQLDIAIALADRANWLISMVPTTTTGKEEFLSAWKRISVRDFDHAAENLKKLGPDNVPAGDVLTQIASLLHLLEQARDIVDNSRFRNELSRYELPDEWHKLAEPIPNIQAHAQSNCATLKDMRCNYQAIH